MLKKGTETVKTYMHEHQYVTTAAVYPSVKKVWNLTKEKSSI